MLSSFSFIKYKYIEIVKELDNDIKDICKLRLWEDSENNGQ